MEKPIFSPAFGNRPDQLIGRDEIIGKIIEGLQSYPGSAERATLVMGQRGMGKTALLLEIADRAKLLGYIPVRITCGEQMLENLIELLQKDGSKYISESKKPIKGFNAGALGFSIGLTFTEEAQRSFGFRVKLEMICEKLTKAGKKVLILVDEVEPSIGQMRELATTYQELVGAEADIAIVMAGLHSSISDTLNHKTLTFLNRANREELELVPISEVEMYYQDAFKRASINANPIIVEDAAKATEGFPYLIQLIGYYMSRLSTEGSEASEEMLERARNKAVEEMDNKIFQAMLNPISETDLKFLKSMAQDKGASRISELEKRNRWKHGTIQTYRKRLIDAGIIKAPRRGFVEFTVPLLADYLRKQR